MYGFAARLTLLQKHLARLAAPLKSRFIRDGAFLASGGLISQFLSLLTAPIMARLYDPEAYGLLGLFIALYGMLTVPTVLQYNQAIILPKDDAHSLAIFKGGLAMGMAMSILVVLFCCLPTQRLLAGTEYEPIAAWFPLMAVMILPGCLTAFAESWLVRKEQFKEISLARVVNNVIAMSVGISIGLWHRNMWGLLIANACGCLACAVVMAVAIRRTGGLQFMQAKWMDVKQQLIHYKQFPLYATPTQLFAQFSRQTPILLLTGFSGQISVGFFNMSNRLLGLPNALFAESFSQIFFQRAAKEYAESGQCYATYRKMLIGMTIIALPFVGLMAIVAPDLFAILLGEKWRPAGDYSRILCLLFAFQLVCTPLASMMVVAKRMQEDLILQIVTTLLMIVAMWLGHYYLGTVSAVLWGYVIVMSSRYLYYAIRGLQLARGVSAVRLMKSEYA